MLKPYRIIPDNIKLQVIRFRKHALIASIGLMVGSIMLFLTMGLNLGIDFLGGTLIEIKVTEKTTITDIRGKVNGLGLGDISIQNFGDKDIILIRVQNQQDEANNQRAIQAIKQSLGEDVIEYRRTETVGPTIGGELQQAALAAVLSAIFAIMVYIWFRFEWQFGIGAIIALTHDVISTIGLFALFGLEFNLATVAAILTIAGYSINDTVVVYDRVRENLGKYQKMPLGDLFDLSISQTLSRTLITSITTLIALSALVIFGGSVIRDFAIAMIWGVFIGTYSSIALAVPMLLWIEPKRNNDDDDLPYQASEQTAK